MLFNSIEFTIFLPIVFCFYWFITKRNLQAQNILLLLASYFFYGWWDWRFLLLLISISLSNYFIGIEIDKNDATSKKKIWLMVGLIVNLGVLVFFKYFNFFIDSFIDLISLFGYSIPGSSLKIVLPIGISFYIFLSISYLLDIYKGNFAAHRNIIVVLLALSFFPIILAGPIQRPSLLIPQIIRKREFSYNNTTDGLRQILWGLFVKIVIADNLAKYVDEIFLHYSDFSGSTLLIGVVLFAVQIYADFSGYSDIAIGIAKLFGFNLMRNFAYPYFSRDITEFWRRWHISLTTWFRDYLFIPVSFAISYRINREKVLLIKSDLFIYLITSVIIWFLTGLWHGANYTFIIWGLIHGFFLILYRLQQKPRRKLFKKFGINNNNIVIIFFETIITLVIVMFAWIFFRSDTLPQALVYIHNIFSKSLFSLPQIFPMKIILLVLLFIIIEWLQRDKQYALQIENIRYGFLRWGIYYCIVFIILLFSGNKLQFIYFQF
jgi:alginate O-acetyltransferase complex protein AlgI